MIDWATTIHEVTVIQSDGGPWSVQAEIPLGCSPGSAEK